MYLRQPHPLALWLHSSWPMLRWLPFMVAAFCSIAIAFVAPDGRKPFHIDWNLSIDAIRFSLEKGPHVGASALLALCAVVATGSHRFGLACGMTVLVGGCWELGQTTVIGHQARWSDLAPDAVGAVLGSAWGACLLWLLARQQRAGMGCPVKP